MSLNLKLSQQLSQKLSPQQIQTIKLIELPALLFEQRIEQEVEENPVLEVGSKEDTKQISVDEYLKDDNTPNYNYRMNNGIKEYQSPSQTIPMGMTLANYLEEQLGFKSISEKEMEIAKFLVGSLDDDGYLRRDMEAMIDDIAFSTSIIVSGEEFEKVLKIIQELEPIGIGARNLRECLLIQLNAVEHKNEAHLLAKKILTSYFEDFSNKRFEKIMERLGVGADKFRRAMEEITALSPKPSNMYSGSDGDRLPYVTADFILDNSNGEIEISLNSHSTPELKISRRYIDMIQKLNAKGSANDNNQEALNFIKGKIESAKWFISAIKQRKETLTMTINAIVNYQKEFFIEGDKTKLRPMILKDIADRTELDVSTISRVVNSKYVQTPFGMLLLKELFSEGIETASGEAASSIEIKKIISDLISDEDKHNPLNDDQLMELLQEKGYRIARRTVAKYRETMAIPIARLRREI